MCFVLISVGKDACGNPTAPSSNDSVGKDNFWTRVYLLTVNFMYFFTFLCGSRKLCFEKANV